MTALQKSPGKREITGQSRIFENSNNYNNMSHCAGRARHIVQRIILERLPSLTSTRAQVSLHPRSQKVAHRHQVHSRSFTSSSSVQSKRSTKSAEMADTEDFILTLSCPDRPGIVHAVADFLVQHNLNIVDSSQFGDPTSKKFFMRMHFGPPIGSTSSTKIDADQLRTAFSKTAESLSMDFSLHSASQRPRVLIMVSKIGHCLNDLLFRSSTNQLKIDIPIIVSNHPDFAPLAASFKIPFHHLPVTADTKQQQEAAVLDLVKEHNIDLIVLARYMQVLSPTLCTAMSGKIINIHHSFLPSFKGAKTVSPGL